MSNENFRFRVYVSSSARVDNNRKGRGFRHPSPFRKAPQLVKELQTKLDDARIKGRIYLPKRSPGNAGAWVSKLDRVEDVKELRAKLHPGFLPP